MRDIKSVYLFPNGNVASFNIAGEQVPELQGSYSIDLHKKIKLRSVDNCSFSGFGILPHGFNENVNQFIKYWRDKNMTWEEIYS